MRCGGAGATTQRKPASASRPIGRVAAAIRDEQTIRVVVNNAEPVLRPMGWRFEVHPRTPGSRRRPLIAAKRREPEAHRNRVHKNSPIRQMNKTKLCFPHYPGS